MIVIGIYLIATPVVLNPAVEYFYVLGAIAVGFLVYVPFVYYKKSLPFTGETIGTVSRE